MSRYFLSREGNVYIIRNANGDKLFLCHVEYGARELARKEKELEANGIELIREYE